MGYQTSVSAEPLLDKDVELLIKTLSPYVTDTIWIGKAEHFIKRLKSNGYGDSLTIEKAYELIDGRMTQYSFNIFTRHIRTIP